MSEGGRDYQCIQPGKLTPTMTCYACGELATSIEHAPPKSWFAKQAWCEPETVPACHRHNELNSMDIQLVGGILAGLAGGTCAGEVWNRVRREITQRPTAELGQLYHRVQADGTITLTAGDVMTLRRAFRAIGNALHFVTTQVQRDHDWHVMSPLLKSSAESQKVKAQIDAEFAKGQWQAHMWRSPECVRWWSGTLCEKVVYRLELYNALQIFLVERADDPVSESEDSVADESDADPTSATGSSEVAPRNGDPTSIAEPE